MYFFENLPPQAVEVGKAMGAKHTILTHFSQRYPKIPVFEPSFTATTGLAFDQMVIHPVNILSFISMARVVCIYRSILPFGLVWLLSASRSAICRYCPIFSRQSRQCSQRSTRRKTMTTRLLPTPLCAAAMSPYHRQGNIWYFVTMACLACILPTGDLLLDFYALELNVSLSGFY